MKGVYLLIFTVLFALSASVAVVPLQQKAEITSTKVAGSVYMIHGTDDGKAFSGGNIAASVGGDGVVLIDTKMEPMVDQIKATIKSLGGAMPRFTINTHVHGDHTGGNAAFNQGGGAVVAHTNIRRRLMVEKPETYWPVITFDESMSIHMNGEDIEILHYPRGHTDGDAVIFFKGSNVVHVGDHYFNGIFPFVDLNSGGTVQGYMNNVKAIIERVPEDVKIIPGHGPIASKNDFKNFYRMMQETSGLVTDAMKAGKSLDEIVATGVQEEWKSWHWSFITTEKWIKTIHASYAEK